jgi:HEAT repeat protein
MREFFGLADAATVQETALYTLIIVIGALLAVAISFSIYTAILRVGHELRARRWARLSALWEQPLLAAISDPDSAPHIHELVGPKYRLHFVHFVLEYARRVRGTERRILRELAAPYLEPLAPRTLARRSEIRTRAVQTLGTLGLPRYAKEVQDAMDDPSPLVAMVAARSLARREFSEYAGSVLSRLFRFETWSRRFLASMLAAIGPEAAPRLRDALGDEDEVAWVRAVAGEALRMLSDIPSADVAAGVVEIEEDRELLASALRLLTVVGRPEHVIPIRVRCASPDFVIRAYALQALGKVSQDESDIVDLVAAMADPSPWVALHAARGIRTSGSRHLLVDFADSDDPRAELAAQVLTEEVPASE